MHAHQALSRARASFSAALGRGDAGAASALYTESARLLPPSSGVICGRAAIEAFWRAGIEVGISEAEFEASEFRRHDGVAYEIGHYTLRVDDGDGSVLDRGKYVLVHERQADGSWRRAVEMFHPDREPARPSR